MKVGRWLVALVVCTAITAAAVSAQQSKFAAWGFADADLASVIPIERGGALDIRVDRQHIYGTLLDGSARPTSTVLTWAAANPGFIYVYYDEPDQQCVSASTYAAQYKQFVTDILAYDSTARFSPGGFAEPNTSCGGLANHFVSYASDFRNAYKSQNSNAEPPVHEWRFHAFAVANSSVMSIWNQWMDIATQWSVDRSTPWVLGSFGFPGDSVSDTDTTYQAYRADVFDRVANDSTISRAVWWSFNQTANYHRLADSGGTLTNDGVAYRDDAVQPSSAPFMWVDTPTNNATVSSSFNVGGWALDAYASNGHGVNHVDIWAYPGGWPNSPQYKGGASMVNGGSQRPDVASALGLSPRFRYSGFNITVSGLSSGMYDLVVYARSSMTGVWNTQIVRVTVP